MPGFSPRKQDKITLFNLFDQFILGEGDLDAVASAGRLNDVELHDVTP